MKIHKRYIDLKGDVNLIKNIAQISVKPGTYVNVMIMN